MGKSGGEEGGKEGGCRREKERAEIGEEVERKWSQE